MTSESSALDSSLLDLPIRHLSGVALYATGFVALLLIWSAISYLVANKVFLPGPVDVGLALERLVASGELGKQVTASFIRVLLGFAIGAVFALVLGTLIGLLPTVEEATEPMIELFRAIPPYAMIPLALLAFGISDVGKLFILAYATFFPVLVSTVSGISNVPLRYVEAGQTLGASRAFTISRIIIPAAFPQIAVGIRLGFGTAWIALIASEMVAASNGLGFMIADARETLDTPVVVGGMLIIGLIGYISNRFFLLLENWGRAR